MLKRSLLCNIIAMDIDKSNTNEVNVYKDEVNELIVLKKLSAN